MEQPGEHLQAAIALTAFATDGVLGDRRLPVCGIPISFGGTASADPDGSIVSYSWNFGDGSALGSGPTVSHAYANGGTFTVTLTVTDSSGQTASVSQQVSVFSFFARPIQALRNGPAMSL